MSACVALEETRRCADRLLYQLDPDATSPPTVLYSAFLTDGERLAAAAGGGHDVTRWSGHTHTVVDEVQWLTCSALRISSLRMCVERLSENTCAFIGSLAVMCYVASVSKRS